jgi:glucose 1-dehydrogenase
MKPLEGKTAVITGAGTGIGSAIAIDMAKKGACVVVNYHSSADRAAQVLQQIEGAGGKALLYQADISSREQVAKMMRAAAETFGGIDVLVNNAGVETHRTLFEYTEEQFNFVIGINVTGTLHCTQAVIPYMKQRPWGRIIMISSTVAKRPSDFDCVYSMSKGSLKMLTREAAIELAKYRITVNTIEPGNIIINKERSGALQPSFSPALVQLPKVIKHRDWTLLDEGMPQDIAYFVSFIASEESSFMTGASVRVDGGLLLM